MKLLALTCTAAGALVASMAQAEVPYIDDRSDPAALVRSLYNAINRQEYARAYSYFSTPPAETVEEYAAGFADTASVDVLTGTPGEEGAAGSIYYQVPTVITSSSGDERKVFAGCYTIRQMNVRDVEAFTPLQIEKGSFEPVEGAPADAMPASCGDGPELPKVDTVLEKAREAFAGSYSDLCPSLDADAEPNAAVPETYAIPLPPAETGGRAQEARLFRFFCDRGAYNEVHVYYLADGDGVLAPVSFAEPELDIRYRNDDQEAPVEAINVIGYTGDDRLMNSSYDSDTLTITSHAKWRGVGDASSSGAWLFRHGAFTLVKFDVDASYDGQINPETVLDFSIAP